MAITAKDVKELRESTGAGMMDCKRALTECDGDMEKAGNWLREKGIAKAAKRSSRVAAEGMVASYVHMGGKIGVLVEINCETDFVARGDEFQQLAKDICFQVCAADPKWTSQEDVPQDAVDAEKQIYEAQAAETGKPANVCEKIAEGKLKKWFTEVCLLDQPSVKPEHEGKSISAMVTDMSGKCGEKITVRRFVRFALGEGLEKKECNFAEEVAAEIAKAEGKA